MQALTFKDRMGITRLAFYEEAVALHESHAQSARMRGLETMARRAQRRAERARAMVRELADSPTED